VTGNVYLVGFMGAGKTTVGRLLAEVLRRKFVDMDELLEARLGEPIPEVFRGRGEEFFRGREAALLKKLARRQRLVVAAGGGAVERAENSTLMRRSGRIVHLAADLEVCRTRVAAQGPGLRPMWSDAESVQRLFERRQAAYDDCDLRLCADGLGPREAAREIAARLFGEDRFPVRLGQSECPVICTGEAPRALAELAGGRRVALLTDRRVGRLHLDRFQERLADPLVIIVPGGERIKTLGTAERVYRQLLAGRFNRDDLLVALGGGAVTDLGAFVAGTYKRGLDHVLVSTSLLGCVDAAVGGKAALNLGRTKNAVGCFTVPAGVVLDVAALGTLARRQIREGLVEAYKTGLIGSPSLAELIEEHWPALLAGDRPLLAKVVSLSARTKAEVVAQDFRESGRRFVLNLGHTFGHAVESWHGYRLSHGRAVALGLLVAVRLSLSRGLIEAPLAQRISVTLNRIAGRPVTPPPPEAAWEAIRQDKKIRQGRSVFVLLEGLGRPVLVEDVSPPELAAAVREVC